MTKPCKFLNFKNTSILFLWIYIVCGRRIKRYIWRSTLSTPMLHTMYLFIQKFTCVILSRCEYYRLSRTLLWMCRFLSNRLTYLLIHNFRYSINLYYLSFDIFSHFFFVRIIFMISTYTRTSIIILKPYLDITLLWDYSIELYDQFLDGWPWMAFYSWALLHVRCYIICRFRLLVLVKLSLVILKSYGVLKIVIKATHPSMPTQAYLHELTY